MNPVLLQKYNVPVPRYTSYPTVPYWDEARPGTDDWAAHVKASFDISNAADGISLYIHLPFCESLCTYCGCNTRITVNHGVERPYLEAVLAEWNQYLAIFRGRPRFREIHLGGGTPTFFSPEHLTWFLTAILATGEVAEGAEFGFEGHPGNTTAAHLAALRALGFTRVSFGIQDFDPLVQEIVNRIQTVEQVAGITAEARALGYTSINFDLIYGLPLQTVESIRNTLSHVAAMRPDRIAFYSYAHVPWIKPGQRRFTEADLPAGEEKRKIYETGRELLEAMGYEEVGMDHFALPTDSLLPAWKGGTLHRNFMGYTPAHTRLLIGLGASSISDAWTAFAQNEKKVEDYKAAVAAGELPIFRGHLLTQEDEFLRRHILNLMCRKQTRWQQGESCSFLLYNILHRLQPLIDDGLATVQEGGDYTDIFVTEAGRPFLRNICAAFDARLHRRVPETQLFSAAI